MKLMGPVFAETKPKESTKYAENLKRRTIYIKTQKKLRTIN